MQCYLIVLSQEAVGRETDIYGLHLNLGCLSQMSAPRLLVRLVEAGGTGSAAHGVCLSVQFLRSNGRQRGQQYRPRGPSCCGADLGLQSASRIQGCDLARKTVCICLPASDDRRASRRESGLWTWASDGPQRPEDDSLAPLAPCFPPPEQAPELGAMVELGHHCGLDREQGGASCPRAAPELASDKRLRLGMWS